MNEEYLETETQRQWLKIDSWNQIYLHMKDYNDNKIVYLAFFKLFLFTKERGLTDTHEC